MERQIPNPFSNAKVIGDGILPSSYHNQTIPRGHPDYVLTRSTLVQVLHCAKRWLDGYEEDDTKSTVWGSLIDALVLTPNHFDKLFAVYPLTYPVEPTNKDPRTQKPWSPNATYCREWKEKNEAEGRTCILADKLLRDGTPNEDTQAVTMKRASQAVEKLYAVPKVSTFLDACRPTSPSDVCFDGKFSGGRQVLVEAEYFDRETGLTIKCKTLIDLVANPSHPVFGKSAGDLKTSVSAALGAWEKTVTDRNYDVQGAMNLSMLQAAGYDYCNFEHVIQENYEPFQTGRRWLTIENLKIGEEVLRHGLAYWCKCVAANFWPDYEEAAHTSTMVKNGACGVGPSNWSEQRLLNLPQFPQLVQVSQKHDPESFDVPH